MLSANEFKENYQQIKNEMILQNNKNDINCVEIDLSIDKNFNLSLSTSMPILKDFFSEKFTECKGIFNGLDSKAFMTFLEKSELTIFNEKDTVFTKGDECNHYYFLLFGDIMLYSEAKGDPSSKLLKTISGGLVFGHKVKDKLQYYAYALTPTVQLLRILKKDLDEIIDLMNDKKAKSKIQFLKKYFPKFRLQSDESIKSLKEYFFRFEYTKGMKLFIDGEFDEYVYIILQGTCAAVKKVKRIQGLKEMLLEKLIPDKTQVILETYGKS